MEEPKGKAKRGEKDCVFLSILPATVNELLSENEFFHQRPQNHHIND